MVFDDFNPLEGKVFELFTSEFKFVNEKYFEELSKDLLIEMYKTMVLSRIQDEWSLKFQRQGRMLTFAPSLGQEGLQVAAMAACRKDDWLAPAFRSNAAWLYKGVPMHDIFLYWCGNEMGSKIPDDINMLPISIPIGSQFNHASGLGLAEKFKGTDRVVVTFIGDGGTSEGEFYEGMNFAGAKNSPVIFIIQNNQYAISTPTKKQTKAKTLAQKGLAAGIPSIKVDGNDVFAMYVAMKEAVSRARKGEGPSLIEAVTYRQGPHTTADDPSIYRDEVFHEKMMKTDPLIRLKKHLIDKKYWSEVEDEQYKKECDQVVNDEFDKCEKNNKVTLEEIFKYTYEEMTENLKEQYIEAKEWEEGKNGNS